MSYEKVFFEPISLKRMNGFVVNHHRHSNKVQNHLFSICCKNLENKILGVVSVSRPISRFLDDGLTVEVRRLCVLENHKNLCSILYSKVIQIAKNLGYLKIITYTLIEENGISIISSNFKKDIKTNSLSQNWNLTRKKPQQKILEQKKLEGNKQRWVYEIKKQFKTIRTENKMEVKK